jgi:hypothetical protein
MRPPEDADLVIEPFTDNPLVLRGKNLGLLNNHWFSEGFTRILIQTRMVYNKSNYA